MKVLLVDDEPLTSESLERYIDWKGLGIESVRIAANGLEALELLPRFLPDIIVSDVRMPRMNGIEFATNARERYPDVKIIFMSGYSDKEYLKSAIHLKAVSYVEKPVKLEEMTAAIRESVSQCAAELANRNLTRSVIRQRLLTKLVKEGKTPAELRIELGEHAPSFLDGEIRAMAIQLCSRSEGDPAISESDRTEIADRLAELAGEPDDRSCLYGLLDADTMLILRQADDQSTTGFKDTARSLLYSLNRTYGDRLEFSIGIGSPSPAKEACLSAVAAVRSRFYFGTGLVFSEPPASEPVESNAPLEEMYAEFRGLLRFDKEEETIAAIDRLTHRLREMRDPEIGRVTNVIFRLLMSLHEFAVDKGVSATDPQQEEKFIWQEVGGLPTLEALRDYVVGNVQAVFSQLKERSAVNARVGIVVQYIREHYSDKELTTRSIADNTYLSQNYMCALFKKETGKTINEFITEIRLERAKALLKDRRVKLYEIALAIGITDPNYFSSMFKKATGLTPSQYRERM
ncbi:response regulator [Cohnella suwonensis]|uniref:Response regulator n=1 Tax=Cohnella suwonensis TaxID=696072 RepID=A0ABW0M0A1_9BACL